MFRFGQIVLSSPYKYGADHGYNLPVLHKRVHLLYIWPLVEFLSRALFLLLIAPVSLGEGADEYISGNV